MTITVEPADVGQRLDAFLAARIPGASRSQIQKAITEGDAAVNERPCKPSYRLRDGDEISIDISPPEPLDAAPEPIDLNIVYEDDDIVVINKPAGMVVHPGAGIRSGTLANALVFHFEQLSKHGGNSRPGIVHRLDAGTSGLIVVARNEAAHNSLAQQFMDRSVEKAYVALVYGRVISDQGRFDGAIGRDPKNRVKMAVRPAGQGRPALTLFRVTERFDEFTLLDINIKTGRTHQIRVHLSHAKHPVVGDVTYGGGRENMIRDARMKSIVQGLGRPFLHAGRLAFRHPQSGEEMRFEAVLPAELQSVLGEMRR